MSTYPTPDVSTNNPWSRSPKPSVRELLAELVRLDRETFADLGIRPPIHTPSGPVLWTDAR